MSSSSKSRPQWIYDVFINFRGADTRGNFVSHLYAALTNAGINTFLDDENLQRGQELGPELIRAIQGSHIAIVVFSQNYVYSSWCLDELVQIMNCHANKGQVVMPVFYGVTPSFLRQYAYEFFQTLKWEEDPLKKVLEDASNLAGWDMRNYRNESSVVKEIIDRVSKKLDKKYLNIPDFPVGLESRAEKLIQFLRQNTRGVCLVGIWGMGGIGKSTIAKLIYNNLCYEFEDQSFLANIREVWEKDRGRIDLQEQLLSDILNRRKIKVHSVEWGKAMIKERLCTKQALVVLDDVSSSEQLNALCGNRNGIGPGSIIIITTRDVRLLDILGVDFIYEVEGLNVHESLELFSWHAFREARPTKDLAILSKAVVAYCGGLPLALEVLGSYLFKRRKEEWQSVLLKLKKIPKDQIHAKLKISFDGLRDRMEKDIFLDLCCFFIGKDRTYVTEILNGCGLHADIGIAVLIERSLIKVEKNNKLGMHDLLRAMGREIVRESSPEEPEKRSRLWCHEDVLDVLTDHTGTKAIEGLVMKLQRTSKVCFGTIAFEKMKKLRLLQLDHVRLIGDYECFPKHLRWLSWQGFPLKYIPEVFYQTNVVAMDLKHSNLKQVWKRPQLLEGLKTLNLSHSMNLTITPDFSMVPNLERLILKDCPNLSMVHESIGSLRNILLINLANCTSVSYLPRMIYKLKSLETLILSGCSMIDKLEEDIVQMESLKTLIADNTAIKQLPLSIVRSKNIGYISLCGYEGLASEVFPNLLWSWMSPKMNSMSGIHSFWSRSSSLAFLDEQNNNLGDIPPMLGNLEKLRSFWVQCDTEYQLSQELKRILDGAYSDAKFSDSEATSCAIVSQLLKRVSRSLLIGMGNYHQVLDALSKSISEGLATKSSDYFLPGDNYPSWLAYTGEGPSVFFQVPEDSDCCMKGITLCVLYSSILENLATECLISVFIINYTKFTIQIYKQDTIMLFNDVDWEGVASNLGVGDNVEIFVAIGHGLTVKEMAVYLIYDQSNAMEIEPSINVDVEPSTNLKMDSLLEVQSSPNLKTEPSPVEEVQPSSDVKMVPFSLDVKTEPSLVVKNEPIPKPNDKIFIRLAKRVGECLCLNQNI